jgi:Mg2+ and Co2+ transporter CorA
MLTLYSSRARHGEHPADLAGGAVPPDAVWIDLLRPDPDEAAFVQRTTGIGGTEHRRAQRNRELDEVLHRLFRSRATQTGDRRPPARESADLRIILRRIGHSGDLASKIRDSLLGIGRIVPFVANHAAEWLPPEIKRRLGAKKRPRKPEASL